MNKTKFGSKKYPFEWSCGIRILLHHNGAAIAAGAAVFA